MSFMLPMIMNKVTNHSMTLTMMDLHPSRTEVRCGNLAVDYPLKGWYYNGWLVVAIFCFILSPFTSTMNSLVFVTIVSRRRLRTVPNLLLCCLAFPDFFCGLISQPIYGIILLQARMGHVNCVLFTIAVVLSYIFGLVSFSTLFLISLERYLAVFFPYWYERRPDKKKTLCWIVCSLWLFAIIINPLSLLTKQFLLTVILAVIAFPLILGFSFFVHFRIIHLVRQIQASISSQERSSAGPNCCHSAAISRATRVAVLILITLLVCYAPYSVIVIYSYSVSQMSDLMFVAHAYAQVFLLLNSFLNPLLYYFQLKELRKEIGKLSRFCKRHRSASVSSSQLKSVSTGKNSMTPYT